MIRLDLDEVRKNPFRARERLADTAEKAVMAEIVGIVEYRLAQSALAEVEAAITETVALEKRHATERDEIVIELKTMDDNLVDLRADLEKLKPGRHTEDFDANLKQRSDLISTILETEHDRNERDSHWHTVSSRMGEAGVDLHHLQDLRQKLEGVDMPALEVLPMVFDAVQNSAC